MTRKLSNRSNYGKLMLLIGLLVAVPIVIVPFYPEDTVHIFSFMCSTLLTGITKPFPVDEKFGSPVHDLSFVILEKNLLAESRTNQ